MLLRYLSIGFLVLLTACSAGGGGIALGPDGKPLPRLYRIGPGDTGRIQFSFVDGVNSLRQVGGLAPVRLNAELNAAAATHSQDMALQNRAWHFGSDGSSPRDRLQRVGYEGQLLGENISETYESELETLAAWMGDPASKAVIMDSRAEHIGLSWFQEKNGKIWWTMVMGTSGGL